MKPPVKHHTTAEKAHLKAHKRRHGPSQTRRRERREAERQALLTHPDAITGLSDAVNNLTVEKGTPE